MAFSKLAHFVAVHAEDERGLCFMYVFHTEAAKLLVLKLTVLILLMPCASRSKFIATHLISVHGILQSTGKAGYEAIKCLS